MIDLTNWIETEDVKAALKGAKARVQQALMPGQVEGGSPEENIGVAYEFPDAKVVMYFSNFTNLARQG